MVVGIGLVSVEGGGEVVGAGGEYAVEVAGGEGGSAEGDDVGESGLVADNRVGVAFDYSGCAAGADAVGGFVDSVEGVGFVVEGCGAGVEVFGGVGVSGEFPSGEADHVAAVVFDGEDDPAAELVVGAAFAGVGYSGLVGGLVVAEVVA